MRSSREVPARGSSPPGVSLSTAWAGAGRSRCLLPAIVAAAVAVGLGVYGKVHHPAGTAFHLAGFSSTGAVKTWPATTAFAFGLVRLVSAFMGHGRLPGPGSAPVLHRRPGRIAFLVAVPVAVHCLCALGYQRRTRHA